MEEQFYVVWPLLLVALPRRRQAGLTQARAAPGSSGCRARAVLTMLVVLSLASLAWSIHETVASPTTAYFSTLTRAWELGVGALVALVPPTAVRRLTRLSLETIAVTGAVLLIAACVLITPETPFPGIAAVLPVAGTAMLLIAGSVGGTPGKRTVLEPGARGRADADDRRLVLLALPLALAGPDPARRSRWAGS